MGCGNVASIKIEPMELRWRIEAADQITVPLTITGADLDGAYFLIKSSGNVVSNYIWFDTGASSDPAPGGVGISVAITAGDSASTIATKLTAGFVAESDYDAAVDAVDTNVILVERTGSLKTDAAVDGDTGFIFAQCSVGGDLALGLTDGDLEFSMTESLFDLTAHQTGADLLSKIRQGSTCEVTVSLKETDDLKIEEILRTTAGGILDEDGPDEVYGWGSSKNGTNVVTDARRLELHPANLGAADLSRDWVFWKAYPNLDSLTFSGENPQMISLTFTMFHDDTKDSQVDLFGYGPNWKSLVAI